MELAVHSNPFPSTRREDGYGRTRPGAQLALTFWSIPKFGAVSALVSPRPCWGHMTIQKYRRNTGGSDGGKPGSVLETCGTSMIRAFP